MVKILTDIIRVSCTIRANTLYTKYLKVTALLRPFHHIIQLYSQWLYPKTCVSIRLCATRANEKSGREQ